MKWQWYHYLFSVLAWAFLIAVFSLWVLGPWYVLWVEYRDLRQGVPVVARYENSTPIHMDAKHDYEKEYRHIYSFRHPHSGERVEYVTQGVGIGNREGTELSLKFNPETGTIGFEQLWANVFARVPRLMFSLAGVVAVSTLLLSRYRRRRSRRTQSHAR